MKKSENIKGEKTFLYKYFKIRSSIYGQVIYVISILSVFLFLSFGLIFRSVNERYMRSVINQTGNQIGVMVEGALFHSMLENDKKTLKNTLEIIKDMPGIDDVTLFNQVDSVIYSSCVFTEKEEPVSCQPDCKSCHSDMDKLFPEGEKAYWILGEKSMCGMKHTGEKHRQLLVNTPILNQPSCYTNRCHVHSESDNTLGALVVNIPLNKLDQSLQESSTDFFIMATIMTILLVLFLIFFTRKKIKDPLNDVIIASKAVANGDMSTRLELKNNQLDDIRMVSYAFNNMLDKLNIVTHELQNWSHQLEYKVQKKSEELKEAQNEMINIERMASLGRLSSSVAHEINNPLAGVLTYTKLVHKQLSKSNLDIAKREPMLKHLKMVEAETKRCGDIVKGLLDFSRKDQHDFEMKSLHMILKETHSLMTHPMKMANINFVTDFSAHEDMIQCAPNQIKQACMALLVNASEAVSENGEIALKTLNYDENTITIKIVDNGVGVAADDLKHVFEPFFTKKQKGNGIGLGLAIVHGIVQNHKGKVEVASDPGIKTEFSITLPLHKNK